jgi:hypothetical protein
MPTMNDPDWNLFQSGSFIVDWERKFRIADFSGKFTYTYARV